MNPSFPNFSIIFLSFLFPSALVGVPPLKYIQKYNNIFFQSLQDSRTARSTKCKIIFCLSLARGFVLVVSYRICRICLSFWLFRLFRWFRFARFACFGGFVSLFRVLVHVPNILCKQIDSCHENKQKST